MSLALAGLVLAAAFVGLTVQGNAIAREIAGYRSDLVTDQAQHDALTVQIANQKTADYVRDKVAGGKPVTNWGAFLTDAQEAEETAWVACL